MSWIPVIALAAMAFFAGLMLLRTRRELWTLFAAALVFGLAGYAVQASPGEPGAPAPKRADDGGFAPRLIAARREFFSDANPPSRFVLTADGYARRGRTQDAAQFLTNAVLEHPGDGEAWLALAIALLERAGGRPTAPAVYAFERAQALLPGNPGPDYFRGIAQLGAGQVVETHRLWTRALAESRPTAPGYDFVAQRRAKLEELMRAMGEAPPDTATPESPAAAAAGAQSGPSGAGAP